MAAKAIQIWGTGRRKTSVARVKLSPGSGKIIVNKRAFEVYFPLEAQRVAAKQPLTLTNNADKVVLTSSKAEKKMVYRHSGYPGGLTSRTYADLLRNKPEEAVRRTIRGMVPKNRLGRQMLTKLKVFAGPNHPHAAQKPVVQAAK